MCKHAVIILVMKNLEPTAETQPCAFWKALRLSTGIQPAIRVVNFYDLCSVLYRMVNGNRVTV